MGETWWRFKSALALPPKGCSTSVAPLYVPPKELENATSAARAGGPHFDAWILAASPHEVSAVWLSSALNSQREAVRKFVSRM